MTDEEVDVAFGDSDFETIESAVVETARGRWFLKEYARRNRNADTKAILAALENLKEAVQDANSIGHLKEDLESMASAIRQTREEIRSFPLIDGGDPASALSEAELQAAAEQRIRRMVQTLRYLDRRIAAIAARCEAASERRDPLPETAPFEEEGPASVRPSTTFLM